MSKDVEKLEEKSDVKTPWALATWMRKKGYKMPAAELPTEKDWKEFHDYSQKISDKRKSLTPVKGEENTMTIGETPKERMETYKPKVMKPTFIDTKPSGKGKSLEEWASDKPPAENKERKKYPVVIPGTGAPKTRKYLREQGLLASEDEDMLVYPEEFKMGMKEEKEHSDVIGDDKEAIKKIVLAHLKEDPHYYTKLRTVMKAEEEEERVGQSRSPYGQRHDKRDQINVKSVYGDPAIHPISKRKVESVTPIKFKKMSEGKIRQKISKKAEEEERKPSQYAFKPYTKQDVAKSQGVVTGLVRDTKPMHRKESAPLAVVPPKSDIKKSTPTKGPKTSESKPAKTMSPKTQQLRQQFVVGKPKIVSKTPIKHSDISTVDSPLAKPKPMEHKGEEDKPSDRDYTEHHRQKLDESSKSIISKIGDKLFGKKAEESAIKGITNTSPTLLNVKDAKKPEKPLNEVVRTFWDKKADETSEYVKSLSKRKPLPGAPVYSKKQVVPITHGLDAPAKKSASLLVKAEEELGEPKKAFDEDALNELYCFLRWMSDKGFKAEDGDKFEQYMDQYEVEKFAEEAQPPAQFKAPEEVKKDV